MKPIDWINIAMSFLRNIPSLVLDCMEISIGGKDQTKTKTCVHSTFSADFKVSVSVTAKTGEDKKYKVVVFITDL